MKKPSINPFRFLFIVSLFAVTSIILSACSKYNDKVTPTSAAKTPAMENDAYAKLSQANFGSLDCSTLNENALNTKYRNKTIAKYGAATGPWYDGLVAAYKSNPNAYSFNPAYAKIYNYKSQITSAIQKGAKDLALSYCTDNTPGCNAQIFWSSYLKDAIDVYLNPIKTAVANDGTLTSLEKGVLNAVIQAYYDNFDEATNYYATDGKSCFPDPSWYGYDSYQADFWGGMGKVIRKIINIAATIVTEIVNNAVYGAVLGLIVGVPFAGVGTLAAGAGGAVIGGFAGLVVGINRCIKGDYVCLVSCI
ncbi:hypothetical protein [Dyadobacter sp. BHUBP1]|uniref:hypothetical protein n=1 Tax=Dyadobacter sp. BHUBP1 TaxID=3424178 RepID=UPI003D34D838